MKENNQNFVASTVSRGFTFERIQNAGKKWQIFCFLLSFMLLVITPAKVLAYNNNPSGVTMTRTGTSATLSWTDNSSYYYYWEVSTSSTFNSSSWPEPSYLKNGGCYGPTHSVTVTGLPTTGTLYAYVAGVNRAWEWTQPSSSTSGAPAAPPAPTCSNAGIPSSASASAASATSANLSWGASSGTATITYYWSLNNSGGSGSTTGTSATATGLSAATSYTMSVYAQSNSTCNTASSSATSSFTTPKYSQTISFTAPATKTYGDANFSLSASAAGGTVIFSSSNTAVATISGSTVTIVGAGTSTITASQAGSSTYFAATDVTQTLNVNKAGQTISFSALAGKTYGDGTFSVSATGGASGNAVTFTSSNTAIATCSGTNGTTITIKGAGSCSIYANQATSTNYSAAAQVAQTLTVAKAAALTITPDAKSKVFGAAEPILTYTPSGTLKNGDFYSSAISGVTMSTNTGINATVAGPNVISVTGATSANYNLSYATSTLTVSKAAALTVTADNKSKVYGASDPTLSYTLTGTLYYGNNASVVSGVALSTHTAAAATYGTHTITAASGVAANYNVSFVTGTLTVSKAPQTIINAVATNRKYDDTNIAGITGAAVNVHYYSDDMQLATATTGVFASKAVANHVHVTTSMTLTGTAAFNYNLTQPDYLYANITPGDIDYFTVAGITSSVIAGVTTTPVVTAYDHWANLKTDYTGIIHFTSTDVKGTTVLPGDFTFIAANNGVKTFTNGVTLTTTGTQTVTVTSVANAGEGNVSGKTGSQLAITVIPAALDHFTLTTQRSDTETAGTPFTVTATAYDRYNNIKTNYGGANNIVEYTGTSSVNWSTTAISAPKGTARIIPANGTQMFTNGVSAGINPFTFYNSDQTQLTSSSPTITITDAATAKTGTTAAITMLNAPLNNFKVVAGVTQTAGTSFTPTVTARDIYLNTCVDYTGSIRFKSSDDALVAFPAGLQAFAPADRGVEVYTNGVTINKIGAYWLRAADSQFAYKSGEQQNIVVSPGAFERSAKIGEVNISTLDVDYTSRIAGQHVMVTLVPRDAQGNLLYACRDISVFLNDHETHLDGTNNTSTPIVVTNVGDGSYIASVRVTSSGSNVIRATFTNGTETPFDQTRTITVTPAPPSLTHTLISVNTGSMTTNGTQTATVQLYDEFDNVRTTDDGVVRLTTTLGGFADNNGTSTNYVSTYNGGTTGSYSATLYASYSETTNGVGTAAISGSIAFNSLAFNTIAPGPGIWNGPGTEGDWPADGTIRDGASVAISEGLPNLVKSTMTNNAGVVGSQPTMTTDQTATVSVQLKDFLGNLIVNNRGAVTLATDFGILTSTAGGTNTSLLADYTSNGIYTAVLHAIRTATPPPNGVGLATISGSFAGTGVTTGNLNNGAGTPANTITTVNITEGLPAVSTIDISAAASPITADESTLVTVQLKDALGNLIVNNRGTVKLSTNLGVIGKDATFGTTDVVATYTSDGKYTATFKMNGIGVGDATITGKYNDAAITDNARVTVINGVATQLAISTAPALAHLPIAGVVFNAQPVIHIKDQWGNLVITGTGSTDQVTATRITSGTAALQGTTAITAVAGVATFTDLRYIVAEPIYIQFTSGTLTNQTSAAISVLHNVPNYLKITGSGTQTAGVAQTITIRAYDVYGNLANRFTGSKSLTFSGAGLSPEPPYYPTVDVIHLGSSTSLSFTAGVATASMILYKVETVDISANYEGSFSESSYTGTTNVNINALLTDRLNVVVSQAAPNYLAITGSATQVAGVAQAITIRAYDSFNNLATGFTGTKRIKFGGASSSNAPVTYPVAGGSTFGNEVDVSFSNGVSADVSMNLYKVESALITATEYISGASGITTRSDITDGGTTYKYKLPVSVSHAPANYYAVTGTGTKTAGDAQDITVKAYDAFNNLATTYTGDVAIKFSGANPSPSTPGTAVNPTVTNTSDAAIAFGTSTTIHFSSGIATRSMKLYLVETAHIVATYYVGEDPIITTRNITSYDNRLAVAVNHAADSFFAITGAGTQMAGVSQDITVTMYDAYNNVATNYAGEKSLTFSGADPSPSAPNSATSPIVNSITFGASTSLTFASGTVTTAMNLYKVQTAAVTATNGIQTADLHKLSVVVRHADQNFMKIIGAGTQTAGVSQNITITAYDAYNNVATRFDGEKSLTFSGATVAPALSPTPATSPVVSATAFGTSTSLTFASGVVTTAMNLYKVETASVTATNTDGAITITANSHLLSVVVSQSAPAYLAVTGTSTQSAGSSQTITITAYDAYNNLATAYTGSKDLVFTGASISAAALTGNNMPTPTTPATSPTVASTAFGTGKAFTFSSGVTTGTMKLYKTETALVSVSGSTISSNAAGLPLLDHRLSVLVTPDLLYGFLVYNVPDPHDLGTWQSVTVQAIDTYNNTKTNYVGKITFSNTEITATNPADYQFDSGDAGIHTFTNAVLFKKVGLDWWLTALDLAEPVKYGAQSGITVQRAVTVTANARSKTYGDVLTIGTSEFTVRGNITGYPAISGDITGVTLSCSGAVATAQVSGSPYTITPSAATGPYTAAAGGQGAGLYRIVYETGNLTVNKRNLTLNTFLADNKTYDGTTDVPNPRFSNNAVNGDVLTYNKTVAFDNKNFGTGKTVNFTAMSISGDLSGNYTLLTTNSTASANIAKRDINVTAQTASKTYDGSTSSSVLPVVDALQTPLVDLVTNPGTQTYDNENVGTSNKVLTPSGTVIDDGNSGANYTVHYVTNTTGTISTRPITITVTASQTKVYGESNPGEYTYSITSGSLATDDVFSGSLSRVSGESVGTYAIGKNTLTIVESSTNKEANYVVTFVGANFSITQRPITLTANAQSKTYGTTLDLGTSAFALTGTMSPVLKTGESVTAVALASSGATNTADVTTYPITIDAATGTGGFTASNYAITYTSGTLTVNQKDLVVTVTAAQTKVYGADDPTFAYSATGYVNSQDNRVFTGSLTRDAGIHVGTTYAINQNNLSAGGNYYITYHSANFSITTKPVTITATTGQNKTYGDLDPSTYTYGSTGLAYTDVFSGILSRATGEDVATYAIGKNSLTIVDNTAVNVASDYNITYTGTTFAINQLAVTVTTDTGQSKIYGDTDPTPFTYTSVPAVNHALPNSAVISFSGTLSRTSGESAGNYAINQGSLENTNYAITFVSKNLTINKRPITLTASAQSKTYGTTLDLGTSLFALTGTMSPVLKTGESVTAVVLASDGAINTANVTTYPITIGTATGTGGFTASNYAITYTSGTLTVNKKDLVVTVTAAQTKVYGEDDPTFAYTAIGFVNSQSYEVFSGSLTRDAGIHVGTTYAINQNNLSAGGNYYITYHSANFSITTKPVTITATTGQNKTYGDLDPSTYTYGSTGLAYTDVFSGILSRASGETVATYAIGKNSLTIVDNTAVNVASDYNITYTGTTFAINQLAVTVTANSGQHKTYGDSDPTLTYTSVPAVGSALANGLTISYTGNVARATGDIVIASPYYAIGIGSLANSNYAITYTGDHFVINQKPITGNFTVTPTKTYDGGTTATVETRTLNGKVGLDVVNLDGGTATYNDKFVGTAKTVTLSGYGLTGVDAFNYSLTSVATTTADITRRDLHLFTFAANSKIYDGNTMASGMGWQDDRLGSDLLSFQWTAEFDSKDVGARHVNYTNIVIFEGTDKPNYNLITPNVDVARASANITVRPLTLTATGVNREYNATNVATITYTDNKVTGDAFGINYTATFNNKDVGTGKAVSVIDISLGGTDASNYSVAATASTTANITGKTITITPDAGQSKLMGASDPVFTYTFSPDLSGTYHLYGTDNFTGALGRTTTGTNPNVGNYSYTLGTLSAGTNYTLVITASPATFAILRNTQDIALIAGWNMISSGIIPASPDNNMLTVFNPLIGGSKLIKIMNESGQPVEYLSSWQNYIGNISSTEGYKVKVTTACTLTIAGNSVSLPLAIPLTTGWNIISFPASGDQNALTAVQALITAGKLEKVMDERGAAIEDWTAYGYGWQNNIGNFAPGKAYLVKVKDACPSLTISEVLNKAATITPEVIASSYFKTAYTGNGFDHMSINLIDLQKSGLRQGDEIGIFDGMVCVGAAMIGADQMISGNMSIPVSANDGLSETINGYIAGNPVRLKLYSNGVESLLRTEILNNVSVVFKKGESLFLKVSTDTATGISSLSQKLDVKFYPNPFTDVLSVEINSSGEKPIDIMIYDVLGRKIRSLFTGSVNGSQIIKWDGTSDGGSVVRPGIYYMRCNGLMFNGIIKR